MSLQILSQPQLVQNSFSVNGVLSATTAVFNSISANYIYAGGSNILGGGGGGGGNGNDPTKLPLTGGTITGDLTIVGNLSTTGTSTLVNTIVSTTCALSVVNYSPVSGVPALYIGQKGPGDIASFYDIDSGIEVLHVGGINSIFPNVGINTSYPNKTFTVNGEISAKGNITTSGNFVGNGSNLTNLNASNITSGTISNTFLPIASNSSIGAVKVDGSSVTINNGIISASAYNIPAAGVGSGGFLGGVKVDGSSIIINASTGVISVGSVSGSGVSGGTSSNVSYDSPSIVLFTGNGIDSSFAIPLSAYVGNNVLDYLISINGLIQTPTINFTINSNSLSFTSPPPKNATIQLQSSNKGTGYVNSPDFVSLTNNGSTIFQISSSLDSVSLIKSTRYFVIINGLVQTPGVDYYISYTNEGRFINFNSSFPVSTNIGIFTFNYGVFGIPEPTITTFVGNGTTSVFGNLSGTKTFTSLNSKDYQVLINGLLQSSVTDYSISSALSGSIIFSQPPPSNSQITVLTNFYGTYSNYVASINGKTGNVNFYASDIPEFQNPYTMVTGISASSDYIGVNINNKIRYLRLYDN
jgi:hypothetical protein